MSDDENEVEEEEQDAAVDRRAASSSRSVPVVELPRKTRKASAPSKTAKKARVEMSPQQELHDTMKTQFQLISDAFYIMGVAMGKVSVD